MKYLIFQAIFALILFCIQFTLITYISLTLINVKIIWLKLIIIGTLTGIFRFLLFITGLVPQIVCLTLSLCLILIALAIIQNESIKVTFTGSVIAQSLFMSYCSISSSITTISAFAIPSMMFGLSEPRTLNIVNELFIIILLIITIKLFKVHKTFIPLTPIVFLLHHHIRQNEDCEQDSYPEGGPGVYAFTAVKANLSFLFLLSCITAGFSIHIPNASIYHIFLILSSVLISCLVICCIYVLKASILTINNHLKYIEQGKLYNEILNMDKTLRAQRHDFLNHMQVVCGLLKMNKFEKAKSYIERLYGEIVETNSAISTGIAELNALFLSKNAAARKCDISMSFSINTTLLGIQLPPFELTKVIGNLLDNAIYAAAADKNKRCINIQISENAMQYSFSITNSGSCINPEIQDKVFLPGFTTKNKNGEGLGLYIVKTTLDKYNSRISCKSTQAEGTNFTVTFPKKIA